MNFAKTLLVISVGVYMSGCSVFGETAHTPANLDSNDARPLDEPSNDQKVFWTSSIDDKTMEWNERDLVVRSSTGNDLVFSSIAARTYQRAREVSETETENRQQFALASVVGDLISFQHRSVDFYTSPAVNWRLTTVSLSKPGGYSYPDTLNSDTEVLLPVSGSKIVSLTEIFDERIVIAALVNDETFRKHVGRKSVRFSTLNDYYRFVEDNEVYWEGDEFRLSPDFPTRFSFLSENNGQVRIRISLTPRFAYNRLVEKYIELDLPCPVGLADAVSSARRQNGGFLMADAEKLFGESETEFEFGEKAE